MKSIHIDAEKYVKATDIARELGYTADYVGQLCRAEKVDAQLVGRSWYVSEDSIRAHKKTRYRSTRKSSKETITQSLETKDLDSQESFAVPVFVQKNSTETQYAGQHFYSRAPVAQQSSYFSDETELIPEGASKNKTGRLSVSLAGAQAVTIKSTSSEYDFNPTERPQIRFAGSLSISEVEDNSLDTEEPVEEPNEENVEKNTTKVAVEEQSVPTTQKKAPTDEITNKIRVKHLRKSGKKTNKKLPLEHNTTGVLGMRRDRISDRNPMGGTLKVAVPSENTSVSNSGMYFILVSTVVSVVISTFVMGLETSVQLEDATLITFYTFDFAELLAAVHASW